MSLAPVSLELRKTLLDRAAGKCEHRHEKLDATLVQSNKFPCWRCEREISVQIGVGMDERIDPYPHDSLSSIYYSLSKVLDEQYEMNHCPHCKAKIGNFYGEEFHLDNVDLFFGVEFIHNIHHVDFNPATMTLRICCSFTLLAIARFPPLGNLLLYRERRTTGYSPTRFVEPIPKLRGHHPAEGEWANLGCKNKRALHSRQLR